MSVQDGKQRKAWSSVVNVEGRRTHIVLPLTPNLPLCCTRNCTGGSIEALRMALLEIVLFVTCMNMLPDVCEKEGVGNEKSAQNVVSIA